MDGEVQEVARNAVRALRGIRLCAEGHEEGRLTHLVLGHQRRTLKVCTPYPHAVLGFVAFCALGMEVNLTGVHMTAAAHFFSLVDGPTAKASRS